ncbi:hypothetical protein RF11_09122 [Thelohanellus kitauei]|uniref:Apextrin C-terminal domain-containing protein n=1 Tax=Thelohanellus kitauei TaxID=669202 RepID=A0A0C2J6H4_THEKT|nr:hypothetical protein RF11_09122 [Thelohanellus kitauei]
MEPKNGFWALAVLFRLLIQNVILISQNSPEPQVLTVYSNTKPLISKFKPKTNLDWPKGTYGMLSPFSGCPDTQLTKFRTGWLFQDTENNQNENNASRKFNANVQITKTGIMQHYCIKTEDSGPNIWPLGSFCVYQYGDHCPKNFHSGYVYWDDENDNNKNSHGGVLPRGNYGPDTEIRFCCKSDGDTEKEIDLPSDKPFVLFPVNLPICQKVKNMLGDLEYIKFDDEDYKNKNRQGGMYPYGIQPSKQDHYLYLCYYTPKNQITPLNQENKVIPPHPVFFVTKSPKNIELLVKNQKNTEYNKYWMTIFFAVLLVTLILGATAILAVKQFVSVGYDRWKRTKKSKSYRESLDTLKSRIAKKYGTSVAATDFEKAGTRAIDCDEVQELAEDYLIPKNSELQHSLALLFMKNQK